MLYIQISSSSSKDAFSKGRKGLGQNSSSQPAKVRDLSLHLATQITSFILKKLWPSENQNYF